MSKLSTKRISCAILSLAVAWLWASTVGATIVRIQTTVGNIDVRLYDDATPLHVANMLEYINSDRYDGTFIHRSAKYANSSDFVIQGGGYKINSTLLSVGGWSQIPQFGAVTNEPGISNLRGTLALAKGFDVNSGTSQWFINMGDQNSFLDQPAPISNAFTVFGRVILDGMTVADQIAGMQRINASVAGSAFGEIPVFDVNKVLNQVDVLNEDVVRLTDVFVRNLPAGDYDFNGVVNGADYSVWNSTLGSTTNAAADGNGNGVVDQADYLIWLSGVPEPASAILLLTACPPWFRSRRRRSP